MHKEPFANQTKNTEETNLITLPSLSLFKFSNLKSKYSFCDDLDSSPRSPSKFYTSKYQKDILSIDDSHFGEYPSFLSRYNHCWSIDQNVKGKYYSSYNNKRKFN